MFAREVFDHVEDGLLPWSRLAIHLKPTAFRIKLRDRYDYGTGTSRNALRVPAILPHRRPGCKHLFEMVLTPGNPGDKMKRTNICSKSINHRGPDRCSRIAASSVRRSFPSSKCSPSCWCSHCR